MDAVKEMIREGDVIQVDPQSDPKFAGCFVIVEEIFSWGIKGYALVPQNNGVLRTIKRCQFEDLKLTGTAYWTIDGLSKDETFVKNI